METQGTSLFIVDDNNLMVTALERYLKNKFGDNSGFSLVETLV